MLSTRKLDASMIEDDVSFCLGYELRANQNDSTCFSGSGGDMAILPFATADPVFLLHHAFVDYLFLIWQASALDEA